MNRAIWEGYNRLASNVQTNEHLQMMRGTNEFYNKPSQDKNCG